VGGRRDGYGYWVRLVESGEGGVGNWWFQSTFGLTSRNLLAGNLACSIEHVRNFSAEGHCATSER